MGVTRSRPVCCIRFIRKKKGARDEEITDQAVARDGISAPQDTITKAIDRLASTQDIYISQFWKLKVQDQGAGLVSGSGENIFLSFRQLPPCCAVT